LVIGFTRLAAALASQGQHRAAIAAVREGMEAQEETAALRWGAELHRFEGIALVGLNQLEEGQKALEEALRVSRDCRSLCQDEGGLPLAEPQFPHRNLTAPHQSVTAV
jgi:hypothetical protein